MASVEHMRLQLSVAPMMERTDRHFRYLMRLVSPNARLYTEMIVAAALVHGDHERLLAFNEREHPVAVQLGGSDPEQLAKAAGLAAATGYDEINLNVGCPSSRVQAGSFGARLMLDPERVAACVTAMREASVRPVTVKTRIGVDEHDDYGVLRTLASAVVDAGASGLIVHARKAWLKGLSPKQNREIPPLDYPRVYRLKADLGLFPVSINGGFTTESEVLAQRGKVDGVMLGRSAYQDPMLIGRLDRLLQEKGSDPFNELNGSDPSSSGSVPLPTASDVARRYLDYMRSEHERGTPLKPMARHLTGLYARQPGARRWRRSLSELTSEARGLDSLVETVTSMQTGTRYNASLTA